MDMAVEDEPSVRRAAERIHEDDALIKICF